MIENKVGRISLGANWYVAEGAMHGGKGYF